MSDFFNEDFLATLPEGEQEVISKYASDWATHFDTQKTEYESKLGIYSDLGDPEELKLARVAYDNIINNPERVLEILQNTLNEKAVEEEKKEAPFKELPPEFADKFKQLEQSVLPVVDFVTAQQKQAQEAANIQAVDNLLADLGKKHGDFDKEFVLGQMIAGKTADQAVDAFKALENRLIASANKSKLPPTMLSGTGTISQEKQPANSAERKALLAQVLTDMNSDR